LMATPHIPLARIASLLVELTSAPPRERHAVAVPERMQIEVRIATRSPLPVGAQ